MADQKVVDKSAKKVAGIYKKGISNIVNKIMKGKDRLSNSELAESLMSMDMNEIVVNQFKQVGNEYIKAHRNVLKTVNPFGKTKDND